MKLLMKWKIYYIYLDLSFSYVFKAPKLKKKNIFCAPIFKKKKKLKKCVYCYQFFFVNYLFLLCKNWDRIITKKKAIMYKKNFKNLNNNIILVILFVSHFIIFIITDTILFVYHLKKNLRKFMNPSTLSLDQSL